MKQIKHLLRPAVFSLSLFCGAALRAQFQFSCGQNLVPNPGFEDHISCPTSISQIALAAPWFQPTAGTSDYFNACGSTPVGVPSNEFGTQPAHGGQAYAGAYMYAYAGGGSQGYYTVREYMEVPLLHSLVKGQSYTVSFYVSQSAFSSCAVDNIGAYLSAYPLTSSTSITNLPVTAQVRNPAGNFLTSANWTLIQGTFTAEGGESYLTIGNFYDNAHTPLEPVGNDYPQNAYYYVDDVSVMDATPCNTCSNNCITISNPGDIMVSTCSNSLQVAYSVSVNDSCCTDYTLTNVPASGFDFPLGTTMVTSTVTDTCGHTNSCTFTVTVIQDTNAPIIYGFPANIIVCGTNGCGAMPDVTSEVQAVTATGGTNVVVTQNIPPGTMLCSNTNVIFTVTDACGDATNCTVPCILSTNPPAIISFPPDIIFCTNATGCANMPDATTEVQAITSLAGVAIASITQSILPGTIVCTDTNVTFTVTDTCGNTTNCTVPCTLINCASNCFYIQCWTNILVTSCTNLPVYYSPTAADGCCSNWFSYCTPPSGSIFNVGTTQTVFFTALDACGNSNVCSFTVTVLPGSNCTNCCPITLSPGTLPSFTAGVAYNQTLTAIGSCACSFYGTTTLNNTNGSGSVFNVTPNGVLTTLVSFNITDGANPYGGLVLASDGNFYGTTTSGGSYSVGTVFRMTPSGALTTLATFNGPNGDYPYADLVQGSDGNFYGTTAFGGSAHDGTVFKMTPSGTLTTLVTFTGANGRFPFGSLVQASDGNFYGTTYYGGSADLGTVFKMTPSGTLTTLVTFNSANGADPNSYLVQASDGNFYGTTTGGGPTLDGTVFQMTPSGTLTTLVDFNGANGEYPAAGLVLGSDGYFYGTTVGSSYNDGTVFKMMPASPWTLTTLATFNGANGFGPEAAVIQGCDGNFYGTTSTGGIDDNGTIFKMTPSGTLTTLDSFPGPVRTSPYASLVQGSGPYMFAVTGGSLPPGLTLATNGTFSGTPSVPGIYCFNVTATDINGCTGTTNYCLTNTCLSLYCSNLVVYTCETCTNVSLSGDVSYSDQCCSNDVNLEYFDGTTSISPTNTCFPVNTTTPVTVVAMDGCGNAATNLFTVTVECPVTNCLQIQCWTNIVLTSCTNLPVYYNPTATDSCCSNWFSFCSPSSGSIFDVGTTQTVTFAVLDACGNSNDCTFTVTVNSPTNYLQVQSPGNILIDSCTNVPVVYPPLVVTDPCCGTNWNVVYDTPSGTTFAPDTHTLVNWYFYDCALGTNFAAAGSFLVSVVCTNCCQGPFTNYTVTVVEGSNYLADCLCQGMSNTLADVLPSVPAGTEVYFWNTTAGQFNPPDTFTGGAWHPGTEQLVTGQGFLLVSFTNQYPLTIYGMQPECGPGCAPVDCFSPTVLVGDFGLDPNPADFCNLFCCPPAFGTGVQIWNAISQSFTTYTYKGFWSPTMPPALPVGYSEFVSVDKSACLGSTVVQITQSVTNQTSSLSMSWATSGLPANFWQPQYSTDLVHWATFSTTNMVIPPFIINETGNFYLGTPYQFYRLASTNTFQTH